MDAQAVKEIEQMMREHGFQLGESAESNQLNCLDADKLRLFLYHLPKSAFHLEIRMISYAEGKRHGQIGGTPSSSSPTLPPNNKPTIAALDIGVALRSANGTRTFGSSAIINGLEASGLRDVIRQEVLKIPIDKLKNAENAAAKCFGVNSDGTAPIRDRILKWLGPKEVVKLEKTCTYIRYALRQPALDSTFWRYHYMKEYGQGDVDPEKTFQEQYCRKKCQQREWLYFSARSPVNILPPHVPEPFRPILPFPTDPFRPFRPDPNNPPFHPLQPHRPIPHDPFRQPAIDPLRPIQPHQPDPSRQPIPPLLGDFDEPNWRQMPGAAPRGDPLNLMPGREGRGLDPDMPEGPNRRDGDLDNFFGYGSRRGGGSGGFGGGGWGGGII